MPAKRTSTKRRRPLGSSIRPRYEADNGPLTKQQLNEIRRLQSPGRMNVKESLF